MINKEKLNELTTIYIVNHGTINIDARQNNSRTVKYENRACTINAHNCEQGGNPENNHNFSEDGPIISTPDAVEPPSSVKFNFYTNPLKTILK